jgi:hypothetical protein
MTGRLGKRVKVRDVGQDQLAQNLNMVNIHFIFTIQKGYHILTKTPASPRAKLGAKKNKMLRGRDPWLTIR